MEFDEEEPGRGRMADGEDGEEEPAAELEAGEEVETTSAAEGETEPAD